MGKAERMVGQTAAAKIGDVNVGIVGSGYIAERFAAEARHVAGARVMAVYNPRMEAARDFADRWGLLGAFNSIDEMFRHVDAVYIASPCRFHEAQMMAALDAGVHVLCEKPMALDADLLRRGYALASAKGLTLLQAVKTAYCPGFIALTSLAKGSIGDVLAVDAAFTKLVVPGSWELSADGFSGSMLTLGSYPLLAVARLLGTDGARFSFNSVVRNAIDAFTRCTVAYSDGRSGSVRVGVRAKSEGDLVVTGSEGYIYAQAPWWQTRVWERRFEDPAVREEYRAPFEGSGLRYELAEFVRCIRLGETCSPFLTAEENIFMTAAMQGFREEAGHGA